MDELSVGEAGVKLNRRAVVARLLERRGELLLVSGLGAPTYDCTAAGDDARNFPLWGAMGGAAMVGLGVAIAQPARPVLVVTGDGEQLMGLGALATIGVRRPPNLAVVVIDNERYAETGGQRTHTAHGVDLAAIARDCGWAGASMVRTMDGVDALRDAVHACRGPLFAAIKVAPEDLPRVLPARDGVFLARRFREAVTGKAL